jgi:hypothetical protein
MVDSNNNVISENRFFNGPVEFPGWPIDMDEITTYHLTSQTTIGRDGQINPPGIIISNNSEHVFKVQIWQAQTPGRSEQLYVIQDPRVPNILYPALPSRPKALVAEISKTVKFTGVSFLNSTVSTGSVSTNTGSSVATILELKYHVGNQDQSESIDVYASFEKGKSWASIWDLGNEYRSKSTSTGQLLISGDLQFNNQSVQMFQSQWPISSTGGKLVGKFYSKPPTESTSGNLFAITGTNTATSGASSISFQKNTTATISLDLTFTDSTGTVYTTSSFIMAKWV